MMTADDLLQDVLLQEYIIKFSKYVDKVEKLGNSDKKGRDSYTGNTNSRGQDSTDGCEVIF